MPTHHEGKGGVVRKTAALAASGLLALTMAGELKGAPAETAAKRDPLFTRTDSRFEEVAKDIRQLIGSHAKDAYEEDSVFQGHKVHLLGVSFPKIDAATGQKSYQQLVCLTFDGSKVPGSVAIVSGAKNLKFSTNERYDSVLDLSVEGTNDYVMTGFSIDAAGQPSVDTYERHGSKNTLAKNGNPPEPVDGQVVKDVFDIFTKGAVNLADTAKSHTPIA